MIVRRNKKKGKDPKKEGCKLSAMADLKAELIEVMTTHPELSPPEVLTVLATLQKDLVDTLAIEICDHRKGCPGHGKIANICPQCSHVNEPEQLRKEGQKLIMSCSKCNREWTL